MFDKKRVLAPKKDIVEVKNAIETYSLLNTFNAYDLDSMFSAHKVLMNGLIENPGQIRTSNVGIVKGKELAHLAPLGELVFPLLKNLFEYLKNDYDLLLLKSCVFYYEFKFIHPFIDGNGRMGRLWQTVILKEYSPVFEYLPIETLIKDKQQEYYSVLGKSDSQGKSTSFIQFMLEIIHEALEDLLKTQNFSIKDIDRINLFKTVIGNSEFTRQEYLRQNKDISSATASRDLKNAVEKGILTKKGDKRLTKYKFKK